MISLRMTQIPFNGTCWMTWDEIHLARKIATVHLEMKKGKPIKDPGGRFAVSTKGLPFEALPFRYLDWLVGQGWLYGEFRSRLIAYLSHPRNAQYLDEVFRMGHWEAEETPADYHTDRWHGQPMPKAEADPPRKPRMNVFRAWQLAADFALYFEQAQDVNDLLEFDPEKVADLAEALTMLPPSVGKTLRAQYATIRKQNAYTDDTYFWAEYAEISPAELQAQRQAVREVSEWIQSQEPTKEVQAA